MKYVQIAYDKYRDSYGETSDNAILALWLQVQIAYNQSKHESEVNYVVDLAD